MIELAALIGVAAVLRICWQAIVIGTPLDPMPARWDRTHRAEFVDTSNDWGDASDAHQAIAPLDQKILNRERMTDAEWRTYHTHNLVIQRYLKSCNPRHPTVHRDYLEALAAVERDRLTSGHTSNGRHQEGRF